MSDILLNLLIDIKICLGLALLIGLITGYLYNRLKFGEFYKPKIVALREKISQQSVKSDLQISQNSESESEINKIDKLLAEGNLSVTKRKNEVSDLEAVKLKLENRELTLKEQNSKSKSILSEYDNKVQTLKSTFALEDISKIEEHKVLLKSDIINKTDIYKQKCDSHKELSKQEQELKLKTSDISSKISSLTASLSAKKFELEDSSKNIENLELKLQKEYDEIVKNQEQDSAKIENFKQQLLILKDKLTF